RYQAARSAVTFVRTGLVPVSVIGSQHHCHRHKLHERYFVAILINLTMRRRMVASIYVNGKRPVADKAGHAISRSMQMYPIGFIGTSRPSQTTSPGGVSRRAGTVNRRLILKRRAPA